MAANLLDFMKIFEPSQLTSMHLVMGTNALGIKKYVAAFTHAMLWQQYIEKNNFPKKDPELFRSENLFVKDRTCLLETTLYGAAGLLQHKAVMTEPAMITKCVGLRLLLLLPLLLLLLPLRCCRCAAAAAAAALPLLPVA